jgi:hypothetical protein
MRFDVNTLPPDRLVCTIEEHIRAEWHRKHPETCPEKEAESLNT